MEDMETIKLILETAGIVVAAHDMTICYDERGEHRGGPNVCRITIFCSSTQGSLSVKHSDAIIRTTHPHHCMRNEGAKYELPKFVLCDPVNLA